MCGPVTYEERGLTLMSPYRYHSVGHPYSLLLKNTLTEAHKGQLLLLCWISNFHCTLPLHIAPLSPWNQHFANSLVYRLFSQRQS